MTLASIVLASVYEERALPVPSVIFPLIAAGVFTLLGAVTWSYRDVAHRHSGRTMQSPQQGSDH